MLDILAQFSAWCLPRICVGCGFNSNNLDLDLCTVCQTNLPWIDLRCYQCGGTLDDKKEAIRCESCLQTPPPYDRLCTLFAYQQPIPKLIATLKFRRQLFPGKLFAALLLQAVTKQWYAHKPLPQVIIPVPLHSKRQRHRGFNQVTEICIPVSKALNIPLEPAICQRIRNTPPQAKLNKDQRVINLASAFLATKSKYEHVVLVDDVVTTGNTICGVTKALQFIGIQTIDVWCVARA